jgi:predicted phosphodiesterase
MKLYAILSDIHGNYAALLAAASDAREYAQAQREIGLLPHLKFIILGDLVDYGPQPNECMQWLIENQDDILYVIQGNHDREVARPPHERIWMGEDVIPITLWTQCMLRDEHKETIRQKKPMRVSHPDLPDFTLFHSSIIGIDNYIDNIYSARENLGALETPYGLFGHTHVQGYFIGQEMMLVQSRKDSGSENEVPDRPEGYWPVEIEKWYPLPEKDQRILINPGSIGQPRPHELLREASVPHDPRAAYMLLRGDDYEPQEFQFRRVAYPVEETIRLWEQIQWPDPEDTAMDQRLKRLIKSLIRNLQEPEDERDEIVDG